MCEKQYKISQLFRAVVRASFPNVITFLTHLTSKCIFLMTFFIAVIV